MACEVSHTHLHVSYNAPVQPEQVLVVHGAPVQEHVCPLHLSTERASDRSLRASQATGMFRCC